MAERTKELFFGLITKRKIMIDKVKIKHGILALIVLSAALVGCRNDDGQLIDNSLMFTLDNRTGLCFANDTDRISMVPCTKQIMKIIKETNGYFNYTYAINEPTQLCFVTAMRWLAHVPCTDEVKKLIAE